VDNSLVVALGITVVGMTLLFLALIFFYGLLSLLTALFRVRPPAEAEEGRDRDSARPGQERTLLRAAAVAVALARAEAEQTAAPPAPHAHDEQAMPRSTSPWWLLHHQRELARNPGTRRTR